MLPNWLKYLRREFLTLLIGNQYVPSDETNLFVQAARHTVSLKGDFLEFGVYDGTSFSNAYFAFRKAHLQAAKRWNIEFIRPRMFAFDSFAGLPEIGGMDTSGPFKTGDYAYSESGFLNNLKKNEVDLSVVVTVKGFYNDTLNDATRKKYDIKKARIIHIDCDLYESAKVVLDFVTPTIQEGTIIIFDDWFQFHGNPDLGEARAFREWLDKNQQFNAVEFMRRLPWSNSFILTYRLQT